MESLPPKKAGPNRQEGNEQHGRPSSDGVARRFLAAKVLSLKKTGNATHFHQRRGGRVASVGRTVSVPATLPPKTGRGRVVTEAQAIYFQWLAICHWREFATRHPLKGRVFFPPCNSFPQGNAS
jgi:hypothetical protein